MQTTIEEIEAFFKVAQLPKHLYLYPFAWIGDVQKFVDNHIEKARIKFRRQQNPYLLRLIDLKKLLTKNMIENDTQLATTQNQLANFKNSYEKVKADKNMDETQRNIYINSYKSMIEELEYQINLYESQPKQ